MNYTGLSAKIAEYIAARAGPKLEEFDKKAEKRRKDADDTADLAKLESSLQRERAELQEQYRLPVWLSEAARRAKQIHMVTHALKYTHSDAKGTSCYAPGGTPDSPGLPTGALVSTGSVPKPTIDPVGNAAALDVAKFLQLECDGIPLVQRIEAGNPSDLRPFAESDSQALEWLNGFRQALATKDLSSHKLAKNVYFPVDTGGYHMLQPLFPTSLAHAIHGRIAEARYSEESKKARDARKNQKYLETPTVEYRGIAQLTWGGTKPQNISYLNSVRRGKMFLLSSAPPQWTTQAKPPAGAKTVFSRGHFGFRVRRDVWRLRQFFLRYAGESSTWTVRHQRSQRIERLVDHLIQYGAEVQSLSEYAGWSAAPACKLDRAEQLWLDPYRAQTDHTFAQERNAADWRSAIAERFAHWLNGRIKHHKLTPGDAEQREWESLVEEKMRLLKENLEGLN